MEVVDKAELMARIENDMDFLACALEVYQVDCPQLIHQTRDALSRRDAAALADAAHTLQGMLSNLSAHPAVETARKLEAIASRGKLSGAEQVLAALESESYRVRGALKEMLSQA